jgi:adenylosuccinate synthase
MAVQDIIASEKKKIVVRIAKKHRGHHIVFLREALTLALIPLIITTSMKIRPSNGVSLRPYASEPSCRSKGEATW